MTVLQNCCMQQSIQNYKYDLCNIHIKLSVDAAETLVQAFISMQSPGLLQLGVVRRHRQLTSSTSVCTERSRQVNHADGSP